MKASLTSPSLVAPSRSNRPRPCRGRDHRCRRGRRVHAHGVAGGMQRLRPNDDRVEVETRLLRIPLAKINPAEQGEQMHRVNTEAPSHTMLAIGRKDEILLAKRSASEPTCAASWPRQEAHNPSSPWRWCRRFGVNRRSTPCRDRSL